MLTRLVGSNCSAGIACCDWGLPDYMGSATQVKTCEWVWAWCMTNVSVSMSMPTVMCLPYVQVVYGADYCEPAWNEYDITGELDEAAAFETILRDEVCYLL